MRIVTVNCHQSYLRLLAGLSHDFAVITADGGGPGSGWRDQFGPRPPHLRLVEPAAAVEEARKSPFDLALAHSGNDLLVLNEICPRRIVLCHRTLPGQMQAEKSHLGPAEFASRVLRFLQLMRAEVVFDSEMAAESWLGLSGRVIAPGIPTSEYGGYTGHQPAVLWATDQGSEQGVSSASSLQQEVLHGIPKSTIHRNLGATSAWSPAGGAVGNRLRLQSAYRDHRCLFVTYQPGLETGFDLELLEAMASGLPVVTTPHATSPVRHGFSGLVGATATELRRHLVRLLHQPELAQRLGANARRTVASLFPYAAFLSAWEELLTDPTGTEYSRFEPPQLTVIAGGRPA